MILVYSKLAQLFLTSTALVGNANCKEVNLRGTIALVIVAGLEVAIRVIEVKGVEFLESLAIEANG
jgi:hypothetical protein